MMGDITELGAAIGLFVGVVVWIVLIHVAAWRFACLKYEMCVADDLVIAGAMGVAMMAPAGLVGCLTAVLASAKRRGR